MTSTAHRLEVLTADADLNRTGSGIAKQARARGAISRRGNRLSVAGIWVTG